MGSAQSAGRLGATIGPFLVGWLLDANFGISGVFGLFAGLVLVAMALIIFGVKNSNPQIN